MLHGNLHHDNILQSGNDWLVIVPKDIIGESAYEVAAFVRNQMVDLLSIHNPIGIIQNRITVFANLLELPPRRILNWCFVQAMLSWVWALEDGCDAIYFEQLTRIFDTMHLHE